MPYTEAVQCALHVHSKIILATHVVKLGFAPAYPPRQPKHAVQLVRGENIEILVETGADISLLGVYKNNNGIQHITALRISRVLG
jgi:hypothetical protein